MFDLHGYGSSLLLGAQLTIAVGACAMLIAILLGLLGAGAKLSRITTAKIIVSIYTTVIRGTPELILLLLFYYGIPVLIQDFFEQFGVEIIIDFNPFIAGSLTLGIIYGAFATEVFRGAFESIPAGQIEAAHALGMSQWQTFHRVLFPQALRVALPGLGNVWMVLIKATALVSIIQLDEIMRKAKIAAGATHQPFTFYLMASFIFLAITLISTWGQKKLEKRVNRGLSAVN